MNEEEEPLNEAYPEPDPEPINKPENVTTGLEPWMTADKEGSTRKDIIPLETEDQWLQIEYSMLPLGATKKIWKKSENIVAQIEREVEKKKKLRQDSSRGVIAALVHSFYLIACIEEMVKSINGMKVNPTFFQLECSQSLGNILQVWMGMVLKHKPYPKPGWLLRREGNLEEAAQADRQGTLISEDPPISSPASAGEAGGPAFERY